MKQYPTAKLYENMGMKERAFCALEAVARDDETEVVRAVKSVPRNLYRCVDAQFTNWFEKTMLMSYCWAAAYWRECSAVAGAVEARRRGALETTEATAQIVNFRARVRALDLALADVCEAAGVHESLVRAFVGVPADGFCAEAQPDEAWREEVRSALLGFLPHA